MQRHLLAFYKVAKWRDIAPLSAFETVNVWTISCHFFRKTQIILYLLTEVRRISFKIKIDKKLYFFRSGADGRKIRLVNSLACHSFRLSVNLTRIVSKFLRWRAGFALKFNYASLTPVFKTPQTLNVAHEGLKTVKSLVQKSMQQNPVSKATLSSCIQH